MTIFDHGTGRFALTAALWLLAGQFTGAAFADDEVVFWLTVLHNNDGESALLPEAIDEQGEAKQYGGAARFTTLAKRLKQEASTQGEDRGVVMLSSGDNFLAGPVFSASLDKGVPYYDAVAMEHIGYDAVCIGNHDFDFGPDGLARFIAGFSPETPFLSANLDVSAEPDLAALKQAGRIAASTLVTTAGERVGIVGATTEALSYISSPRRVAVGSVQTAVQAEVDRLQAEGVDKIILISHLQDIDDDLALIPRLRGVDIAIAGGGDELLANADSLLIPGDREQVFGPYPMNAVDAEGREVPVITTSGSYRYIGRLVAGFDAAGKVAAIDRANSGPLRVAGSGNPDALEPDAAVQAEVADPVQATLSSLTARVIARSEVPLNGRRTQVRTRETNQGNLIADAVLWQARRLAPAFGAPLPEVALQNGGGIRNDAILHPGEVSELDTFQMAPFSNFVTIVAAVPRAQFKEILENAVAKAEGASGRFAQIAGFNMAWDLAGAARATGDNGQVVTSGERVREVTLADGTKIVADGALIDGPAINIATLDFLARGGDQYPFRDAPIVTLGVTYQQALRDYIVEELNGVITKARYPAGGEGRNRRRN